MTRRNFSAVARTTARVSRRTDNVTCLASSLVRTKHHWLHGKLYVVENVDAEVCRECGERYYHATTFDVIDKLLEGEHEVKMSMDVEVVSL